MNRIETSVWNTCWNMQLQRVRTLFEIYKIDDSIRIQAIKIIRTQLLPSNLVSDQILQQAVAAFTTILQPIPPEHLHVADVIPQDEQLPDQPVTITWNNRTVKRTVQLFLSLCGSREELLQQLVQTIAQLQCKKDEEPKMTLLQESEQMFQTIGATGAVMSLVKNYTAESEDLAYAALVAMTRNNKSNPPSSDFVQAVKDSFFALGKRNPKFILRILPFLTLEEMTIAVEPVISMSDKEVEDALEEILRPRMVLPMTPAQFLVALHKLEPTKTLIQRITFGMCNNSL